MIKDILIMVLLFSFSLLSNAQNKAIDELASQKSLMNYNLGLCNADGFSKYIADTYKIDTIADIDIVLMGIEDEQDNYNLVDNRAYKIGRSLKPMIKEKMKQARNMFDFFSPLIPENIIDEESYIMGFCDGVISGNKGNVPFEKACNKYLGWVEKIKTLYYEALYRKNKDYSDAFMENNKYSSDVIVLPCGVQYKVLEVGHGDKPTMNSTVNVEYKMWDVVKDILHDEGVHEFKCSSVIIGLGQALVNMPEGSVWEVYIPYNLAYGAYRGGKLEPFMALVFQIKLNKIVEK